MIIAVLLGAICCLIFREVRLRQKAAAKMAALNTAIEEKLRQMSHQAEESKNQFLANISHELRTPLNAVIGYSEMMAGGMAGELSEKQIGYADKISKSGRHLLDIINDLLDLTNMDAGRLKLNYETVYISPLFNTLQDALTPLATEQQITLVFTSQNCPQSIVGDNERVNQILNKLITNAIKFNKAGGEVRVRALGETDWIRFEVEDNGVGIPAQEVEQLFTAFYQVDSSSTRLHEGTGLGLALTKRLVELQGGTIAVESQEGKGSKFIVRLPVSPA